MRKVHANWEDDDGYDDTHDGCISEDDRDEAVKEAREQALADLASEIDDVIVRDMHNVAYEPGHTCYKIMRIIDRYLLTQEAWDRLYGPEAEG